MDPAAKPPIFDHRLTAGAPFDDVVDLAEMRRDPAPVRRAVTIPNLDGPAHAAPEQPLLSAQIQHT